MNNASRDHLINEIIDDIMAREGGYSNHPQDRGGPTNHGITQSILSAWLHHPASEAEVRALMPDTARPIYLQLFYIEPGFECIADYDLLNLVIDSAVQHGPMTVIRWLQRICDVAQDGKLGPITSAAIDSHGAAWLYRRLLSRRIGYYFSIIAASPSQSVFARGWYNRLAPFIENAP